MTDWNSVIVAAISFLGTAVGAYGGFRLTAYRVAQLEKKVDKHNSFAERVPLLEKDVKNIYHELDELRCGR